MAELLQVKLCIVYAVLDVEVILARFEIVQSYLFKQAVDVGFYPALPLFSGLPRVGLSYDGDISPLFLFCKSG